MHMIVISPTFYKDKIKNVHENPVCPGKHLCCCFFVNGNVFFSQHILNKAKIHHLINVFSDFPGAYCRKYTVLINKIILKW